ncbi:MAG: TlyA family RNA methyltransferase [Actinomycetota bacterium]|nr:TlyA family RNA methyltransferase [Actinomycetota bacterium]
MSAPRRRLDVELVRRRLAASRQEAQAAISSGRVLVGGALAERASRLVAPGEPLELLGPPRRFVGRGGEKLDAALDRFSLDIRGSVVLDAGASTGGFTDCLIRRGAALVAALDVGHGQLDPRLRADEHVVVLERTNIRTLRPPALAAALGAEHVPVDAVTADLSFISLRAAIPVLAGPIVRAGGSLVLLVKPQFEVGRAEASRTKGVVRDPELWLGALRAVASSLVGSKAAIMDAMRSPVTGASGNTEFFVHAVAHTGSAGGGSAGAGRAGGGSAGAGRAGAGGPDVTLPDEVERVLRQALAAAPR